MDTVSLSQSSLLAWKIANTLAVRSQSDLIELSHLYLAILSMLDGIFWLESWEVGEYKGVEGELPQLRKEAKILLKINDEELTTLRRRLFQAMKLGPSRVEIPTLHRSEQVLAIFRQALIRADKNGRQAVTIIDLLQQINTTEVERSILSESHQAGLAGNNPSSLEIPQETSENSRIGSSERSSALSSLGINLSDQARRNKLPPVIGREAQMTAIARVLSRTSKRNVILVGEAGVGKTAVVEGLAQKFVSQNAPDELRRLKIVQINISDLTAGTHYRGDMEARLRRIIEEACADPDLILFIDEIHLAIGTGATGDSAMDIANILKPALARDDFRCIGATTHEEYERNIKKDPAFKRRFQVVTVPEPTLEEAVEICSGWIRRIEAVQDVRFVAEAAETAVRLSSEYLRDRFLPDKAIDLLENSAAYLKVSSLDFQNNPVKAEKLVVTPETIKTVLQEQYGVVLQPLEAISPEGVFQSLQDKIFGQEKAIEQVAEIIPSLQLRKRREANHPLGVLLFTGPTGVGKTFTAQCVSKILFPNHPDAFVRFGMNEYKERYDLARLIGAAPGLIGHDQSGVIFRFVETHPQGVILLDEFEKAHPEIQDFFLQIFDCGEARDSRGRLANFRGHLFVLTTNLLSDPQGHVEADNKHDRTVTDYFRPEFMGRVDKVIEFSNLTTENYLALFEHEIENMITSDMAPDGFQIDINERDKLNIVLELSGRPDGVRGFLRRFEQQIASPIITSLQSDPQMVGVLLQYLGGKIVVSRE